MMLLIFGIDILCEREEVEIESTQNFHKIRQL